MLPGTTGPSRCRAIPSLLAEALAAAGLIAGGFVREVLLIETAPTRIQAVGLMPMSSAIDRRELRRRGVPAERIAGVAGAARTLWEWARQLGAWLDDHPDSTVLV